MVFSFPSVSLLGSFLAPSPYRPFSSNTRYSDGSEAPTVCGPYQVRLSVFHDLIECPNYSYVPRNRGFPSLTSVPPCERLSLLLSESPNFSASTLFAFLSMSGLMSDL